MKIIYLFCLFLYSVTLQAQTIVVKQSELRNFKMGEDFSLKDPIIIATREGGALKAGNYKMVMDTRRNTPPEYLFFTINASGLLLPARLLWSMDKEMLFIESITA